MPTGYSGKPLFEKLGIKEGAKVVVLSPPRNYKSILGPLPPKVKVLKKLRPASPFIHFFATCQQELVANFPSLKQALTPGGMLWVSWPKRASKISTDLDENRVREIGLSHGLVDVKVCAVDETWSGLKFVYRIQDRK